MRKEKPAKETERALPQEVGGGQRAGFPGVREPLPECLLSAAPQRLGDRVQWWILPWSRCSVSVRVNERIVTVWTASQRIRHDRDGLSEEGRGWGGVGQHPRPGDLGVRAPAGRPA